MAHRPWADGALQAVVEQAELYKENIRKNPPSYLTKPNILNNYIQVMLNAIQCLISSLIIEKNIYNDHALVVFHQIITYIFITEIFRI